ncbi:MAG TPA: zinc-ribbon domain-containing protein [Thermomicrobiales bacterium]|nr:zinc-ribbon domain-containing protein [Thermomicrobiales bacterium]
MEKCPNCGAAVRPGAKFCTSCGTRLPETPAPSSPTPTQETPAATGSTQTATPAAKPEQETSQPDPYATWGAPSGETATTSTPADRFEAGLDGEKSTPGDTSTTEESSSTYSASSWGRPATPEEESDEDRFASWAAAYGSYQPPTTESAAGCTEPGTDDAANTSTESMPAPSPEVVTTQPAPDSEARKRAVTLIDELRELVWQIGVTDKTDGDKNLAKVVLAGARGQSSDFTDLKRALDDVKASPRDVDVLAALSSKADRIQELLDSHNRLLRAIDEAIDELR